MINKIVFVVLLAYVIYRFVPKVTIETQQHEVNKHISLPAVDVKHVSWNDATRKLKNKFNGPESFTHNPDNGDIYTGSSDGMIWKINKDLINAEPILRIGDDHPNCESGKMGEVCGRILGLKFLVPDKLIVADAYKGIIAIHLKERKKQVLVRPDENMLSRSLKLFNSVDISKDGIIYFTVSSMKWVLHDFLYSLLENENSGRVYSYNLITKELNLIASNLAFANGIALTTDENELIVSELFKRRLLKINLLKSNEQPKILMENLPGYPDNIKRDNNGNFYVALAMSNSVSYWNCLMEQAFVRSSIAWLIPKWLIFPLLISHTQVYHIDNHGKIITVLNNTNSDTYFVTEAYPYEDKILLGNLDSSHFDVINTI